MARRPNVKCSNEEVEAICGGREGGGMPGGMPGSLPA